MFGYQKLQALQAVAADIDGADISDERKYQQLLGAVLASCGITYEQLVHEQLVRAKNDVADSPALPESK